MVKRKTKKQNSGFLSGLFVRSNAKGSRVKKKSSKNQKTENPKLTLLKLAVLACVLIAIAGLGWGFKVLEDYVLLNVRADQAQQVDIVLVDKPGWVNQELVSEIFSIVRSGYKPLQIDQDCAEIAAQNLIRNTAWLVKDSIRVETKHNAIEIHATYRKPIVMINIKGDKYYIDQDLCLLNYVPMPGMNIIEVRNFDNDLDPVVGMNWRKDDIAAAILLTKMFHAMDERRGLAKPLLSEVSYIDVKDYGSRNVKKSQLVLVVEDNTRILWGAPFGKASVNLEADESEKLEKIYATYELNGTLQGVVKYIDPRIPSKSIPSP